MKYVALIKGLVNHELVSGSFYIFIGITVSSFLAFILNIYFARELSYADYGTYSSLLSIVTLLTIPSSALSAVIVRYATQFFSKGEKDRAGAFYKKSFKYLIVFSFLLNLFFILIFPAISSFLKIEQLGLVLIAVTSAVFFYLATLNIAFMQSLLKFKLLGIVYTIAGIGKLAGGVILILVGFKVHGAIFASLIFSGIDFILSLFPLKNVIKDAGKDVNIGTKDFTSYALPTSIALFSLSSFISTDVLLVKHFFSATEAGFYGGLNLVGKVIFYFTGPIAMVMFPLIVKKHSLNESFNKLFYAAVVLVAVPSILITIFYFIFPQFTLKLFLGGEGYLAVAPYLGIFGIFLTIYSINNVFINFFISIKKTIIWTVVLFWAVTQIVLIFIFHENFYQIVYTSIITSVLLLISLVLYYLRNYGFHYARKQG